MVARELKPCGTHAAYRRHHYNKESACRLCTDAATEYEIARQRKKGNRPRQVAECGTHSGYIRHLRLKEDTCNPCRQAHVKAVLASRRKIRQMKRRGTIADILQDYVETYAPLDVPELVMLIQLRHNIPTSSIRKQTYRMLGDGRLNREDIKQATFAQYGNPH